MRPVRPLLLLIAVLAVNPAFAERLAIPHAPRRYTVRVGDTLWGIATHFFKDPWKWPSIWNRNRQIHNPDLIYPGDVIVLRYAPNGRPYLVNTGPSRPRPPVRPRTRSAVLEPRLRSAPLVMPIPTLNPNVIEPFLARPLALSRRAFHRLGYIASAIHRHTVLGTFSWFYAQHLGRHPAKVYDIYRRGPAMRNRDGEFLAYETVYVGRAKLVRPGRRLPEFEITSAVHEIQSGDWLVPWRPRPPTPYYYPRAPHKRFRGQVVATLHNHLNLGAYAVIALDLGKKAGMRRGYVLRLTSRRRTFYNPVAEETEHGRRQPVGLVMVFRTFKRVSFGVVMQSRREIHIGDHVATP